MQYITAENRAVRQISPLSKFIITYPLGIVTTKIVKFCHFSCYANSKDAMPPQLDFCKKEPRRDSFYFFPNLLYAAKYAINSAAIANGRMILERESNVKAPWAMKRSKTKSSELKTMTISTVKTR